MGMYIDCSVGYLRFMLHPRLRQLSTCSGRRRMSLYKKVTRPSPILLKHWYLIIDAENEHPGDINQGLIELGSTVCTVRGPSCATCPLRPWCAAYKLTYDKGDVVDVPCLTEFTNYSAQLTASSRHRGHLSCLWTCVSGTSSYCISHESWPQKSARGARHCQCSRVATRFKFRWKVLSSCQASWNRYPALRWIRSLSSLLARSTCWIVWLCNVSKHLQKIDNRIHQTIVLEIPRENFRMCVSRRCNGGIRRESSENWACSSFRHWWCLSCFFACQEDLPSGLDSHDRRW